MERALELYRQLQIAQAEGKFYQDRARDLQDALPLRDRLVEEATRGVKEATIEIEIARAAIRDAGEDLKIQRSRLAMMEKELIETLKAVLMLLEKLEGRGRPSDPLRP